MEQVRGWRCPQTNLWKIPLNFDSKAEMYKIYNAHAQNKIAGNITFQLNSIYDCKNTNQLIQFYHACLFSPVSSTWIDAITAGYFQGWPGLTTALIHKHITNEEAIIMGHMQQIRKGTRSTKPTQNDLMVQHPQIGDNSQTHFIFMTVVEMDGKIATDQTGQFPQTSSMGSKYIMVAYIVHCNAIIAKPLKSRSEGEMLHAYNKLYTFLQARGF